jgi:hypothetical protein
MTPEGLIGALGGLVGQEGSSQVIPAAVGIAVVDELSTLIDKNAFNSGMIAVLTDLYDARDFEYLTRGRGKETVKNPCLSILGGSTLHWIKESIPIVAIGGGFTSRIVFIYKDNREKLFAWPVLTEENKQLREMITHDLCEIAKMRGPFGLEPEALTMYKKEYEDFYNQSVLMDDELLGGYANRRHHILLKVAMITSASVRDSRVITKEDMAFAIGAMRKAEESMPLILKSITSKEIGNIFEAIIRFISRKISVSHSQLIQNFRHQMTSQELQIMMKTLEDEGLIKIEAIKGVIQYTFKGKLKS